MNKPGFIRIVLFVVAVFFCLNSGAQQIKVNTPPRPNGQKDVLRLACPPIPLVRIALVGVGFRGSEAVLRLIHVPGAQIVAFCDMLEERTKFANQVLVSAGQPKAKEFFGKDGWKQAVALPEVDLVYVATDWKNHANIGKQAMLNGKHAAIEVPGASTMADLWDLVNTAEKTQRHCMMLENCVYGSFELTTLNMVQQGLFGEILHADGGYIHSLDSAWFRFWNNWRLDYNADHRGDLYPTHGLGPLCLALNIHRGDKMDYLVSVDTKVVGIPEYIKEQTGKELKNFKNADHTTTMIRTRQGKTIQIQHNVANPRPYTRMYQLTGTRGYAMQFPVEAYALDSAAVNTAYYVTNERVNPHQFVTDEMKAALVQTYKHPILRELEDSAKKYSNTPLDYIMDYRLIYCLQKGLPLDMDVYDLAEWSCLVPLSELSLENNSAPVEIPDFTRGAWNKLKTVEFSK